VRSLPRRNRCGASRELFQKKSHHGIATDKHDIDIVAKRLREAEEIDRSMRARKR
jgi:hypothetical protein